MSVNSLANFGAVGLNGTRAPVLQPIFSNRWRSLFFNFGSVGEIAPYDLTRQVNKMSRPNVQFEAQTLYSYISSIYVVNRGEWKEMTIGFYDDITNSVMRRIQNQIAKQQNFFDQTGSRAGENYKFEIDLDILAGGSNAGGSASDPNIIQKWCYSGCSLIDTNLGEMDFKEEKFMELEITVRYDNVIGFDENGVLMGNFSHLPEITGRLGVMSTGIGIPGGSAGISLANAAVGVALTGVLAGSLRF